MSALYLLRFDDLCPTMNRQIWTEVESLLIENEIAPLLGVIPDNQYPRFNLAEPNANFWEQVRGWAARGWTIAMHGHQHVYTTSEAGIVGLNARSEFAGLAEDQQRKKIQSALAIFRREGLEPQVWMAPANSFDDVTLRVVRDEGIRVVNDGLSAHPYTDETGLLVIPQQLWRFRRMAFGVWTVSFHHNFWQDSDLHRFERDLTRFRKRVTDLDTIISTYGARSRSTFDSAWARTHLAAIRVRRALR